MFNRVLVVCLGNICRSPAAEIALRHGLQERGIDAELRSAGLGAMVDWPMAEPMQEVVASNGLTDHGHKAQQITQELCQWADLILVMTREQKQEVERRFPETVGKVQLLGRWNAVEEVEDPYHRSNEFYAQTFQHIESCLEDWYARVWS